jgi:hypothetical protein
VIPCRLTLESGDNQALEMFSAPSAPVVTLRRCVRFQNPSISSKRGADWVESFEDVSCAVWWPSPGGQNTPYSRCLEGEIKLPKDLASTSSISRFSVSVRVCACALIGSHSYIFCSTLLLSRRLKPSDLVRRTLSQSWLNLLRLLRRTLATVSYPILMFAFPH